MNLLVSAFSDCTRDLSIKITRFLLEYPPWSVDTDRFIEESLQKHQVQFCKWIFPAL